MTINFELIDIM